eukprot:1409872-Rhodomonas_salina.2
MSRFGGEFGGKTHLDVFANHDSPSPLPVTEQRLVLIMCWLSSPELQTIATRRSILHTCPPRRRKGNGSFDRAHALHLTLGQTSSSSSRVLFIALGMSQCDDDTHDAMLSRYLNGPAGGGRREKGRGERRPEPGRRRK